MSIALAQFRESLVLEIKPLIVAFKMITVWPGHTETGVDEHFFKSAALMSGLLP